MGEVFYRKCYLDFNRRFEFTRIHVDILCENGDGIGISRSDVCVTFDEMISIAFEVQRGGIISINPDIKRVCQHIAAYLWQDHHKCEVIIQHLISNGLVAINKEGLLFIPNWTKWIVDEIQDSKEDLIKKEKKRELTKLRVAKHRRLKKMSENDDVTHVTHVTKCNATCNATCNAYSGVTSEDNVSQYQVVNDVTPYLLLNTNLLVEEKAHAQTKKESEGEIKITFDKLKTDFPMSFPVGWRNGDHAAAERILYDIVVGDIEFAKNLPVIASKWVLEASKGGYLTTPERWLKEKKWLDGILESDGDDKSGDPLRHVKRVIWKLERGVGCADHEEMKFLDNFMNEQPSIYRQLRLEKLKEFWSSRPNSLNDEQKRFLLENTKK